MSVSKFQPPATHMSYALWHIEIPIDTDKAKEI